MNIRQFVNPADGMVQLQMSDGSVISRWPIDAKQMISKGAKPVSVKPGSEPAAKPAPAPARKDDFGDDEG